MPNSRPKVVVVGAGIGGCAAALALHRAGADVTVYEQAQVLREIGAGINIQAVAIGVLEDLGISVSKLTEPACGDGIRTSRIEYFTRDGAFIVDEAVGMTAGASHPQLSAHRAKFHGALVAECRHLLGEERVVLDHSFARMEHNADSISLHFCRASNGEELPAVVCDFAVGCDGLKSSVRAALLGPSSPRYTGRTIFRGVCEVDRLNGDGSTVSLCGDENANFICYPISEGMRQAGSFLCNWALVTKRPEPTGMESWTAMAKIEDISEELAVMEGNSFGGLTPLQLAQRSDKIIAWALFDRDPIESFDFGPITLLGDAAHPLLPYGSQGATQAIMDAEALGVAYQQAMDEGTGVKGCVKMYSDMRCQVTSKIVIANRDMGSTAVLREANQKCKGMPIEEKRAWCKANGPKLYADVIAGYREAMPKSVRPEKRLKVKD